MDGLHNAEDEQYKCDSSCIDSGTVMSRVTTFALALTVLTLIL